MTYTTTAPARVSPIPEPIRNNAAAATLETRLKAALEHARRMTEMYGSNSIDTVLAWETVEELQYVNSSRQSMTFEHAFAQYCAENPNAPEARMYDV